MQKQKRKIRADRLCTVHYAGCIKNQSIAAGSSLPRSTPLHLIRLDLRPIPSASKTYFLPVLPLACRWGDCDQVCESPSQLAMHMRVVHLPSIAEHIPSYASVSLLPHLEPPLPPPELPAGPVFPVHDGSQSHPKYASDDDREDDDDEGDMDEDKDSNLDQIDEDQEHPCRWGTCDLTFSSDVALTDHLTSDHVLKGKLLDCLWGDCPRRGENPIAQRTSMIVHLRTHTGYRPFKCGVCGEQFSNVGSLQVHERQHTGERPFVCEYQAWGKGFTRKALLNIHKNAHTGERPFKCAYFEAAFADPSVRRVHENRHVGDLKYLCSKPGCTMAFVTPAQCQRHEKSNHNKLKKY